MTDEASAAPVVWVLEDPRAGTAAQALGIAERLGVPFRSIPLAWSGAARLAWPWPGLGGLTPEARGALMAAAVPGAQSGSGPRQVSRWPDLVLSAGRRAAPVARWLARRGARTVHCMRPGWGAGGFDLLVIGQHDSPRPGRNVLPILGACHRLSPAALAGARQRWSAFESLPSPRIAFLAGGPVQGQGMDPALAAGLVPRILRRFPEATILATTSRRTGAAAAAAIGTGLEGVPHRLFRWGDTWPNPYAGFLAWADAVVVTGDSVSMLSEACATGVPVLIATVEEGRHRLLAESLVAAGRAAMLDDGALPRPPAPLDESGRVAAEIRARGWLGAPAGQAAAPDAIARGAASLPGAAA
jgi:mitochondrial fission protein ELM1